MKKFHLAIILILFLVTPNFSQVETYNCVPSYAETGWNGQIGGKYLPADGTIRVLLVFAQFPDDPLVGDPRWLLNMPPADMNNWVDETWSSNATSGYLTDYFNDMSFNKLKFIGKEVYKISPHSLQWYLSNNKKRGDIHKEIIQSLDATWDFAQFDTWDYNGEYNLKNTPDGVVDFIVFIWRHVPSENWAALDMGRYGSIGGTDFTVDNGARTIKAGFPSPGSTNPGGSGATLCDFYIEDMQRFTIHEFGHYLQGGNDQHVGYGFWGLLSGWGVKSYVANAFERYRLGWINLNTIQNTPNQTISNATLPDYITTGIAYRLVIDAASNQYFYIENHQGQSIWETTKKYPGRIIENGIYVLRQDGGGGDDKFIRLLAASGRYNWTVNQRTPNPWGTGLLPVFKRLNADAVNGYTEMDWIPWWWNGYNQGQAAIHFIEDANGNPVEYVANVGHGTDAFRMGYNQVFSPFSNPNSQRANGTGTPFGFSINGFNSGVASLNFYVGTYLDGPPSKPQNLTVTQSPDHHPSLTWSPNMEPDKNVYVIYKSTDGINWTGISASSLEAHMDNTESMCPAGEQCANMTTISYKVAVLDRSNKYSVLSDAVSVQVIGYPQQKIIGNIPIANLPLEYNLSTNYPNPFNPSTIINYAVKEAGLVSIKVYDILGAEIATLVNETKEAGDYAVEFNASTLPSGIYIYTMQVNNFSSSKKMLLMK